MAPSVLLLRSASEYRPAPLWNADVRSIVTALLVATAPDGRDRCAERRDVRRAVERVDGAVAVGVDVDPLEPRSVEAGAARAGAVALDPAGVATG